MILGLLQRRRAEGVQGRLTLKIEIVRYGICGVPYNNRRWAFACRPAHFGIAPQQEEPANNNDSSGRSNEPSTSKKVADARRRSRSREHRRECIRRVGPVIRRNGERGINGAIDVAWD